MPPTAADPAHRTTIQRFADAWNASTATVRALALGAGIVATASGASGHLSLAVGVSMAILVTAALVDAHERRLPNNILALAMALIIGAGMAGSVGATSLIVGAAIGMFPVLALHLAAPRSMGFGDVKLSAVIGSALGTIDWRLALWALALGSAVSAVFALAQHQSTVAFGPGLIGAGIALMALVAVSDAFQISGS